MTGCPIAKRAILFFLIICTSPFFSMAENKEEVTSSSRNWAPHINIEEGLDIFRKAYPDVSFVPFYDEKNKDYRVEITVDEITTVLYWADGSFLPLEELKSKEKYWPLLYNYPKALADPANFSDEQIASIKGFSSTENRKNSAGTPMFFFEALYDAHTKGDLESHLVKTTFLGRSTTIHERMVAPFRRVEKRINALAKTDSQVKAFISSLKSSEAYYWRIIAGTNRKSFHSFGIAMDLQPKSLGGKAIFWSWTRDKNPSGWMLTPLKERWLPPQKVIDIFEDEGFIWGGKWVIFDNMHFEYHPELIEFNYRHKANTEEEQN